MSIPEIGYRTQQFFQKRKEKRGPRSLNHKKQDYNQVLQTSISSSIDKIPEDLAFEFSNYCSFDFFGLSVDLNKKIDWHHDIVSGKKFPLSFSKDIDIRSDRFGSAKVVWEINRLQFLLPIAINYSNTKDPKELEKWMHLLESWIKNNPYLLGVNWYSNIEVNIRLIVWYFCWQIIWQNKELKKDEKFTAFVKNVWLPSIYEHCVYSFSNPSKYSSANNHLVAEYSGLFVASCCWKFNESEKWKNHALQGLEKEIQLQYSESGINKEQAAEYIQFITDFFLIPYAVGTENGIKFSDTYRTYLFNISVYLTRLLDINKNYRKYGDEDDGKVLQVSTNPHFDNFSSLLTSAAVLFNDGRFKLNGKEFDLKNWLLWSEKGKSMFDRIQPKPDQLKSFFYKEDGQFFFRKTDVQNRNREIYMHFDAAPLGFLSIAAHGHADALSIALHVDGFPIIVDIGTYTYHTEAIWRNYFISTLAHNTICIDHTNQAFQAGPTMWLKHYKVNVLDSMQNEEIETVSAEHSGYKKIGCSHQRTVEFNKLKDTFSILDKVLVNNKEHIVLQPWHFHPDVIVKKINDHQYILKHKNCFRSVKVTFDTQLSCKQVCGQTDPILGWFSKSFLQKEPTTVIEGSLQTNLNQEINLYTTIEIF